MSDLLFAALSLVYIFLSVADVVSFTIWPSVEEYLGGLDPYLYFERSWEDILLSPWGVRTGIAMPALFLAEFVPLTQEQAFSLQCALCLVGAAVGVNRTAVACFHTRSAQHQFAVGLFFFLLGVFMNGRLCSALLGSAILMYAHVRWIQGRMQTPATLACNFLALALMTVSTGTFLVGLGTVALWFVLAVGRFHQSRGNRKPLWPVLIGMLPVLYFASVQAMIFTDKLYDYYEGTMIDALSHGYGKVVHGYLAGLSLPTIFLLVLAASPFPLFLLHYLLRTHSVEKSYMLLAVALTVILGACGFSTLFTNTPTAVLAVVVYCCGHVPSAARPRAGMLAPC